MRSCTRERRLGQVPLPRPCTPDLCTTVLQQCSGKGRPFKVEAPGACMCRTEVSGGYGSVRMSECRQEPAKRTDVKDRRQSKIEGSQGYVCQKK